MKALLPSLLTALVGLCLLAGSPAHAQTFPNSTFDNWATRNGVDSPTNWLTTDDLVALVLGVRYPTNSVVKSTTVHGGTFAVQLQNQSLLGQTTLPGEVFLGMSFSGGAGLPGGLPFTARPRNLTFYYQLSGSSALADSAVMAVQLTRRVGGTATVVAQAQYLFTATAANYTLVTVPLQYQSGLAPDSVTLAFTSGSANNLHVGNVLRVDDVVFTGTVSATRDAALDAALTVSPNPSPDGRYVLQTSQPGLLAAPLTVLDATGRIVRHEKALPAAASRPLDLSELPSGIYTVQLATPDGLLTRKLSR